MEKDKLRPNILCVVGVNSIYLNITCLLLLDVIRELSNFQIGGIVYFYEKFNYFITLNMVFPLK